MQARCSRDQEQESDMRIKIWGSRGSRPVAGREFQAYGGETSCIEVRSDSGEALILDAGTGIGALERAWKKNPGLRPNKKPVICLSHGHLDHVQGLPFFSDLYRGGITILSPFPEEWQQSLFDARLFPVPWSEIQAQVESRQVSPRESLQIGPFLVETVATRHPGGNLAWKISADGQTFVYTGDHEMPTSECGPVARQIQADLLDFMSGADVALVDASFTEQDYIKGWGHSYFAQWPQALADRNVGWIGFTHLNPEYDDAEIDSLLADCRRRFPEQRMFAAFAGCEIDRNGPSAQEMTGSSCAVCDFFQRAADLSDTHAVLDAILTEARKLSNADAGTIYLIRGDELEFSAAQNDSIFPASLASKYAYMNARLPITNESIAGHVAVTGEILNLDDVYDLPSGSEFGFNPAFDEKTGYRTKSMLSVPIVNAHRRIIGVLQLINSRQHGESAPFAARMQADIARLAAMATIPLERSFTVTSMILRMLSTSALRDPAETGAHVRRVGAMAAELYQRWAEAHGVDPEKMLVAKSQLRLAAMLHDVGKVGIPDAILKKPGRLDSAERGIMERHAALGAGLFDDPDSEIDSIARDIVLHHHAKWNGTGYTGSEEIASPAHEDIPLGARITAIADVYDALASRRCYKEAWEPEKALEILRKDAGSHFDPELVQYFCEIQDVVQSIYERYRELQG